MPMDAFEFVPNAVGEKRVSAPANQARRGLSPISHCRRREGLTCG